jgi:hypothetical protein
MSSWPAVNPGRLRHQITIWRPKTVAGVSGSKTSYELFITAYAEIDPAYAASGQKPRTPDVSATGQITSRLTVPITMNWEAGIEANMQVQTAGGMYVIESVVNVGELNVTLILMCLALRGAQ